MSVRAGEHDWVARWREMQADAERASGREAACPASDDRWRGRAERFDRACRRHADAAIELLADRLIEADVVADIGAGTGRHVIPLSRRCARALAIEPSAAMRAKLEGRLAEEPAPRVTIVPAAWPCALPIDGEPRVDVSYSCHVLYGVVDAPAFLDAMTRATRRACLLVLGLRAPMDGLGALWRELHGAERPRRPAALEALALLHQLGHRASLQIIPGSARRLAFADQVDDLNELCHRLALPPDEHGRARAREALERLYPRPRADADWDLGVGLPNALIEWSGAG